MWIAVLDKSYPKKYDRIMIKNIVFEREKSPLSERLYAISKELNTKTGKVMRFELCGKTRQKYSQTSAECCKVADFYQVGVLGGDGIGDRVGGGGCVGGVGGFFGGDG